MGGRSIETNTFVQNIKYMDFTDYLTVDRISKPCVTQLETNDSLEIIYNDFILPDGSCVDVPAYIYESESQLLFNIDDIKRNGT